MADLTITHTPAEGTLIDGTSKGDPCIAILRANRWRWGRSIGCWFVPQSRDRAPKRHIIRATVAALESAGHTVSVDVEEGYRPASEVEADKIARQADRVDALAAKADRAATAEQAADERATELTNRVPFGQPILQDHYSAPAMRRHYEGVHKASHDAVQAYRLAEYRRGRAEVAAQTTDRRYRPGVVARRIETKQADVRRVRRQLDGTTRTLGTVHGQKLVETTTAATGEHRDRLGHELAHIEDEIAYWQGVREQQIADGTATPWDRSNLSKGDRVYYGGEWLPVQRVNAKSVTVPSMVPGYTDTLPYNRIVAACTEDRRRIRIINGERSVDAQADNEAEPSESDKT